MRELGTYLLERVSLPLAEQVETIAWAGFDFLCASFVKQLTEQNLCGLAARYGLPVDNVHLDCDSMNAIWESSPRGDMLIDSLQRQIAEAARCGVDKGIVHVTWGLTKPDLTEIGLERLERLTRFAETSGFTLCFENSVSMEHLCYVLDNIRSKNALFCFDTGHWNAFTPGDGAPFRYAGRLGATHIQDNDAVRDLHLLPFDGCVDFAHLAPCLRGAKRLALEPGGIACGTVDGENSAEIRRRLRCLAIANDKDLIDIQDGSFTIYSRLSYRAYIARAKAAAVRLDALLDRAHTRSSE